MVLYISQSKAYLKLWWETGIRQVISTNHGENPGGCRQHFEETFNALVPITSAIIAMDKYKYDISVVLIFLIKQVSDHPFLQKSQAKSRTE